MNEKQKINNERNKSCHKLLVVGTDDKFSDKIIDYAIGMAARMSYDLIALNSSNVPLAYHKEFKEASENNVKYFEKKASQTGVEFQHTIKFNQADKAIEEAVKEAGEVDFVVAEELEDNQSSNELFVYSLA